MQAVNIFVDCLKTANSQSRQTEKAKRERCMLAVHIFVDCLKTAISQSRQTEKAKRERCMLAVYIFVDCLKTVKNQESKKEGVQAINLLVDSMYTKKDRANKRREVCKQ